MSTILHGQDAIIQQPDAMTHGMSAYNSLATDNKHPVEAIQKVHFKRAQQLRENMAHHIYGKHFVEGLQYEQEQLAKLHAHGYGSEFIGVEISRGSANTISNEDYMSLPKHQPQMDRISPHQVMQKQHDAIGM